jgi:hypothetical protein
MYCECGMDCNWSDLHEWADCVGREASWIKEKRAESFV